MTSEFPIDVAYKKFTENIDQLKNQITNQNESLTRLRFIDTILFDILQWDKNSVETEKYCRANGFADYVFYVANRPILVLEAKKTDINFVLPDKTFKDRPYQFGFLAKECKKASEALEQACGYAATLGSIYIAITNGHQWLFMLAFVPNQPIENRLVFIFESLEAIKNRFSKFCKCFNQEGITSNTISRELLDNLKLPAPAKLSSQIPGYPQVSNRNIFQNELSYILDYVWQVMAQTENSEKFVENCYVNPHSHNDILALAKELIAKRRREDDIISEYNIETIEKLPQELANLPAEKPFIILGEVGRGKSSFLKYLRFVAAKDNLKNYIQIELNFIDRPDTHEEIYDFVYNEIERQLIENFSIDINEDNFVRGVLNLDLMRLKNTTRGKYLSKDKMKYDEYEIDCIEKFTENKHIYLTKVFHHLKKGRKKSLALFFDNLDRRSSKIQEETFLKASAIARDWASLVFICLRPLTYYNSQESGVLDTIAPTTFTVGNPDLSLVLKRRFSYAKQIANGKSINITASSENRDVSLDLACVSKIFEMCEFAAWKKHGIIPTLEAISNGNIRRLINFTRTILTSGHLDTKKILNKIESTGKNYYIPDYEGVKTLLFGDYEQFDSTKSPFINIFDIQYEDASEHFLKIAILHYLSKTPNIRQSNIYSNTNDLISYLTSLGFSYNISIDSIKTLIKKRYIHRAINHGEISDEDTIKISSLGRFHIFNLLSVFQYIDATIVDTPILDENIRDKIKDVYTLDDRIERTELFLSYLNTCIIHIIDSEIRAVWEKIYQKALENIEEIKMRNKR